MPLKSSHYKLIREHFLKLLGNKCTLCGSTENLEFDHIKPNGFGASRGRDKRAWDWFISYAEGNLQILCKKCNREKSDK